MHVDVYRLDHLQELHDLGFDDLVGGEAVTVVEWGDRVSAALPSDRLRVLLEPGDGDDDRVVSVDAAGITWGERRDAAALGRGRGRLTCCCSRSTRRPRRCRSRSATVAR